jgi:hypothetical protein
VKRGIRSVGLALFGAGMTLLPALTPWAVGAGITYQEVARLGATAPGGGQLVNDFEAGRVSPQGEVAFVVDYNESNSEGLYLASNGKLIPIVEPGKVIGASVPGWSFVANGPIQQILSPVGMNGAGDISFGSDIQKQGSQDIRSGNFLWIRKTGQYIALDLPDTDAPDHGKFDDTKGGTWTTVNDQDDAAFAALVTDPTGDTAQGVFVRTMADGKVHTVARAGDAAPDGGKFIEARRPNLNNAGEIVFEGHNDKDSDTRIYGYKTGKVTTLVAPNTDYPGIGKLTEVKRPRINNKSEVIFLGSTDAGWGLYHLAGGTFSALLLPGAALPDGAKLDHVLDKDGSAALADSGNVGVLGVLLADGGTGVYLLAGGQIVPVARDGVTLQGLGALDNADGEHVALNANNQVAFQATFKDGHTGLILATLQIP